MLEDVADDPAGILQILIACLVSFGIVDDLQVVHIQDHNGEPGSAFLGEPGVEPLLGHEKGMPVLHAGQRVDIGIQTRLRQVPGVVFLLTDLRVYVIDAGDQAASLLFFEHHDFQHDIARFAIHRNAITERKETVLYYIRHDVFFGKHRQEEILIHILWAGDSRIYLLDQDGLAQVTRDDTDIEDAFENLTSDGAMTNVLSSDGDYVIHSRTLHIEKPVILIAATDGCFGYVPSPVEFERLLLEALLASPDPPLFKSALRKFMGEIAGDDLALSFMSFFFGDYKNMQASFADRMHFLKAQYPEVLRDAAEDREILKRAWKNYRHSMTPLERSINIYQMMRMFHRRVCLMV